MIVGATNAITKAPLTERTAPASHSTGDAPSDALSRLGNLTESAAHSRKAFAEERLKQLREQMSKLMLFDLEPRALAGQSAQFARELRAAAEDFSAAFEALAGIRQPETTGLSLAQQAYLDIDDEPLTAGPTANAADLETMESFASTAQQIDSMAERAGGRLDPRDDAGRSFAIDARKAAAGVVNLMTRISNAAAPRSFYW
ncbi:hypothetical protein [Hoeflea alexandrii]|uniref:hypothetical protein n=1 Tax=Hoeflea alexandrii TaxID=288436 RepID=UPI0022AFDCF1|nr:hypothetical protein [Hoeflea alexandrii]MCZ4289973.1 hypothetical protein [Hoeflea alexandrii]